MLPLPSHPPLPMYLGRQRGGGESGACDIRGSVSPPGFSPEFFLLNFLLKFLQLQGKIWAEKPGYERTRFPTYIAQSTDLANTSFPRKL